MENGSKFYMVKKKALPEILLKVAEANVLLNRGKAKTIKEAIDAVGISRSSYYKYKDDIFPIHEKIQGKTITFVMEMEDQPGLLSRTENCGRLQGKYLVDTSEYTGESYRTDNT